MSGDLRRDFSSRDELAAYLAAEFPDAAARGAGLSPTRGGRREALRRLAAIRPARYAASRNFLDGAVTRLSPFLRHGVLSLAEVRDAALAAAGQPDEAAKLVQELGWRDYWRRAYGEIGNGVWRDREPYRTGWRASSYAAELPPEIERGESGLACIDAFARELRETGYLHNHARMWTAAYVVHWRRVRWQAGTRWFLRHLLDGDPASNNLSWQWVAGTFSGKPYIFNRDNLARYSGNRLCESCPMRHACPFDDSYEELHSRLFPNLPPQDGRPAQRRPRR